jgi:hypothetical protein
MIAALFVLTFSTTALACPSSEDPAFEWMINGSTLVVRGEVLRDSVNNRGTTGTKHWSEVRIVRTYKGAAPNVIRVRWNEYHLCPRARLIKGDYGLFFLRKDGSDFVLVEEQFGKVNVSRSQNVSIYTGPLAAIERDFKRAVQVDSGRQLVDDVLLLGSLRRPIDTAELRRLLPTRDSLLESAVHLALLKLRDYSQLQTAGGLAETVTEHVFHFPAGEAAYLRSKIGHEIMGIKEPEALPVLRRFLLSPNYWLRRSAANAVRTMQDFSSLSYLIRLLDDPSKEIRIQALHGLRELTGPGILGRDWLPGTPRDGGNITDEEAIARWRAWWRAEGRAKYANTKSVGKGQ